MKARLITSAIFCFMISINIFAATTLCVITSDIDSNYAKLTYELDQATNSIKHIYQESYENNILISTEELKTDSLNKGGVILLKKDKIIVVRIWSDNFDKEQGGVLYLDTLYSGISGERKQYEMDVAKSNTGLVLINNKTEFSKMKFIAKRSKLLGVIGIEKVLFSK